MSRGRWVRRAGRRARLSCAVAAVLAAGGLVVVPAGGTAQAAGTFTVSGTVYRDLDDDGVQDPGEPGVPGIRVHRNSGAGTPTATTDADGHYVLTGLAAASSGELSVETGWFRSQCTALNCPAGPGPDNDFQTSNQFIRYPLSKVTRNLSDLNVGLLPDWPGTSARPPDPVGGAVPANTVDIAARLSWATSTCTDGKYDICRPGDTYTVTAQLHNQGTTPLTGITAALALPAGDRVATGGVQLHAAATSPGITGLTVRPADADGSIPLSFAGVLVPGGLARVTVQAVAGGSVGPVGCVRAHPTAACPSAEPGGSPLVLRVTHVDQPGDPDSFGPDCPPAFSVRQCPTGVHDKQVEPDEVDPVGHNMDAGLGTSTDFDLTARVDRLSPEPADGWSPGDPVTWRLSVFDTGPMAASKGWKIVLLLPLTSQPAVPAANAMRSCTSKRTTKAWSLTCTGKGPLGPDVTSVAVDVTAPVPATAAPGSTYSVLGYVRPATVDPVERVPLGTAPTDPTRSAAGTATDNDASGTITIG